MKLGDIVKRAGQLTADNSPAILTGIGVAGTLLTAYLTNRAAMRAAKIIHDNEYYRCNDREDGTEYVQDGPLPFKEKFVLTWKCYIPPAGTAALTVAAIISGHRISSHRATALAAAYAISSRAWEEFENKVEEKLDPKKVRAVREEIAQDRIDRAPISEQQITIISDGDTLCLDAYSDRPFKQDYESLRKAQNDVNLKVIASDDAVPLSDFYELIGLTPTSYSDEVGWDRSHPLNLRLHTGLRDNKPCLVLDYQVIPIRGRRSAFRPL